MMVRDRPKVGIGVWVEHEGKFLLSRRKTQHGQNKWALPGGHLENGESWEECSKREVDEECGLQLENLKLMAVTNDVFEESGKHYITIHMHAKSSSPDYENREPHKHECFEWLTWEELKQKDLFLPVRNCIENNEKP